MQEQRAAGVVEALRRRLQVSARVRRDSSWQVIPARELVPGDIVRVRPGDIIPADVKLLTGALSVDQSALTGESKDADKKPGEVLSSGSIARRGEGIQETGNMEHRRLHHRVRGAGCRDGR
jgi:P-type E1-E2 ATPase